MIEYKIKRERERERETERRERERYSNKHTGRKEEIGRHEV